MKKDCIILGSGLVGSLLSVYLIRHGYQVRMFERRSDMRKLSMSAGKSINLALSDRGLKALEKVGLASEAHKIAIPMYGRMMHAIDGTQTFQPYGKDKQAINSISRGLLNALLMDEAERHQVEIKFDSRCTQIDLNENIVQIENQSGQTNEFQAPLVFGADGAFSELRHQMMKNDRFDYHQYYQAHGYKELEITPDENGKHRLEKNALHIWPRGGYMLIALPNLDGSFTVTLFFPYEGDPSFTSLDTETKVESFFNQIFPDVVALMPNLVNDFFENPTGSLVTVKCSPWTMQNRFMLIGDAAHAIVPFYGQGMNCGFEDCFVLNQLIVQYNHQWEKIMPEYQRLRKPAGDAIADLAVSNFIEMRDRVADPMFLLRKKIEGLFHARYPDKWLPLYSMVTFSDIPYNVAKEEGERQEKIMDEIMRIPLIEKKWDSDEVENKILKLLN